MSDVNSLPLPELSAAAPPAHGAAAGPGVARAGAGEAPAEPFGDVLGRELQPGKDPPAAEPGTNERSLQSGAETGKPLPVAPAQAQAPVPLLIPTAVPAAPAAPVQAAVATATDLPAATATAAAASTATTTPATQVVAEQLRLLQTGSAPTAADPRSPLPAQGVTAAAVTTPTAPPAPPASAVPADVMLETTAALRPTAESIGRLVLDQAAAAVPPPAHSSPAGAPPAIADSGALQLNAAHGPAWFGSPVGIDGAPAAQATAATPLPVPFGQAGWDQALGQRVVWMAGNGVHEAKMQLNPPQLGPLEVRVQLHHDQASIVFTSHHAQVRDALDAALPRLREAFAESGLNLVDVNVGHQPPAHHGGEGAFGQHGGQSFGASFGSGGEIDLPLPADAAVPGARGLVDYYV